MSLTIRPFAQADKLAVMALLSPYFKQLIYPGRWEWEWKRSPSASIILCAYWHDRLVGHYSLIAYDLFAHGSVLSGGKIEGSCVDADFIVRHRKKHPELTRTFQHLIERMIQEHIARRLGLVFGFPNKAALYSQTRNGFHHLRVPMIRFWATKRPYAHFRNLAAERAGSRARIHGAKLAWSILSVVGYKFRALLKSHSFGKSPGEISIERVMSFNHADDEFLNEYHKQLPNHAVTIHKTIAFLTWRYLENPNGEHLLWRLANNDGHTVGIFVTFEKDDRLIIEDWILDPAHLPFQRIALNHCFKIWLDANIARLEFEIAASPLASVTRGLATAYFPASAHVTRETIVWAGDRARADIVLNPANWLMTDAFREGA